MSDQDRSFKGVVWGGGVVLEEGATLRDGTPVLVTVRNEQGSPGAVLAAMTGEPRVEQEDVDALLTEIERGKRPVRFGSPVE
ncbi:MAG: hypothetical protein M9894_03585 [Planctomycetes bacterium]|nr:hypothetical protein [Planctomycetota bacterium]